MLYLNFPSEKNLINKFLNFFPLVLFGAPACQYSCIQGCGAAPLLAAAALDLPIMEPETPAALLV